MSMVLAGGHGCQRQPGAGAGEAVRGAMQFTALLFAVGERVRGGSGWAHNHCHVCSEICKTFSGFGAECRRGS